MAGTHEGAMVSVKKIKETYGNDFFARIGAKGGAKVTKNPKGFAANPELAKHAGHVGGRKSKRGVKSSEELCKARRDKYYYESRIRHYENRLQTLEWDDQINEAEELLALWQKRLEEVKEKIAKMEKEQ